MSNAVIAELCKVSTDLVRRCRFEMDKLQSATAIDYAETALNVLNRMKADDPRRPEAVARIERWLAQEKAVV
jgi:hypothetical protein